MARKPRVEWIDAVLAAWHERVGSDERFEPAPEPVAVDRDAHAASDGMINSPYASSTSSGSVYDEKWRAENFVAPASTARAIRSRQCSAVPTRQNASAYRSAISS